MHIFVDENNIRKESEFMAVAKQRQVEGLLDIRNLILNKKPRSFVDLMDTTWKWSLLQLLFKESVWKNAIPNGFSVSERF